MRKCFVSFATSVTLLFCVWSPDGAWAQEHLRSGHFMTSDGVRLHYLEAGSGPAIVFVPGWTAPAEIWQAQMEHFAPTHRVVALDPRSQGRSERPSEGHYLSRRGKDIGELIEHLDEGPVVVVGWSVAVLEVLTYAEEHGTEALRGTVLVDMFIGMDLEPGKPSPLAAHWLPQFQADREAFTRAFVRGMYRSEQSDEYLESMAQAMLKTPTNTAVTLIANVWPLGSGDWRPALDSLDRPVLYAVTAGNAAQADMVRERRPDARVEVFEEAGHALFVDRPELFNEVLQEFLSTLPDD